jgi:hypothetical protein
MLYAQNWVPSEKSLFSGSFGLKPFYSVFYLTPTLRLGELITRQLTDFSPKVAFFGALSRFMAQYIRSSRKLYQRIRGEDAEHGGN